MTIPARFYSRPDGTQSTVQMVVGPDGEPRPLEVKTPAQLADWNAIQDALPPSPSQADAKLMASLARPLFNAGAEADNTSGADMLSGLRAVAAATDAVSVTTEISAPANQAEWIERANAAARLAASLGLSLVHVRDDDVMHVPAHLEIRGRIQVPGDLATIERVLADEARKTAKDDEQIRLWREHQERIARERAEAIANLSENRLSRLEAALSAQGITVDA